MTARFIVADVFDGLSSLPDGSVDCVITSPPYLRQRRYLPLDHPTAEREMGHEATPGEFLEALLAVMDELWRVLSDDGTFWINLGTKHAGSGGAGGDYNPGGLRDGQPKFNKVPGGLRRAATRNDPDLFPDYGHTRKPVEGWPLEQSVCWVAHLFGASLAYGRNLLTGDAHRQWVTRPPVTWCKPAPTPGAIYRTFRSGTELVIFGGKHQAHYFDLDSVRYDPPPENERSTCAQEGPKQAAAAAAGKDRGGFTRFTKRTVNPNGAPPLNWWVIGAGPGYAGAHFATFPAELLIRPILAGCPKGGTVLDPFVGSGTTLVVATGHERNAIGIDFNPDNVHLAQDRLGMLYPLTVETIERQEEPA